MSPARFNECLEQIRWSGETFAVAIKCEESLVKAYAEGLEEIPASLGTWLDTLAQVHSAWSSQIPKGLTANSESCGGHDQPT